MHNYYADEESESEPKRGIKIPSRFWRLDSLWPRLFFFLPARHFLCLSYLGKIIPWLFGEGRGRLTFSGDIHLQPEELNLNLSWDIPTVWPDLCPKGKEKFFRPWHFSPRHSWTTGCCFFAFQRRSIIFPNQEGKRKKKKKKGRKKEKKKTKKTQGHFFNLPGALHADDFQNEFRGPLKRVAFNMKGVRARRDLIQMSAPLRSRSWV